MPVESAFVDKADALRQLMPEWDSLSAKNTTHMLSLSYRYFDCWRRVFGAGVRSGVVTLRQAGDLLAVMPIMIARCRRGPALSVRFDYHPHDTEFVREHSRWRCLPVNQLSPPISMESGNLRGGYLTDPTIDGVQLRRHLASALMKVPGWTVGIFPIQMAEREGWLDLIHGRMLTGFIRPSDRRFYSRSKIEPWDDAVQKMSRNARKSVARAERRAEEAGLRCTVFDQSSNLHEGFRNLAEIALESWKQDGRDGSPVHLPYAARQKAFYESLGATVSAASQAVIFCLFLGQHCRAAALVIRNNNTLTGCVTCYAPEIAALNPGRLIIKAMTDWAIAHGIQRMDFNATDPWVEPFSDTIDEYGQLVIFNRGPYPRALNAIAQRMARPSQDLRQQGQ